MRLGDLIKIASYKPPQTQRYEGEEDDLPDSNVRIMAICYSSDRADASFAVVIDENGNIYYVIVKMDRIVIISIFKL